ncbi:MAG TPA: alcohol dehydrogenase catalytic domain-containing protein [Pyrinomonadaceae bacterium]|nr:alcohol dehydrogenase catalytic domain-containing protein [Pyrinomonadaceae bacterium]
MHALRVEKKKLSVKDIAKPERGDEALVRVLLSGICNTDLEIARGYAGFKGTLGHEFVGVVEESPENKLLGQRVVGEINAGCGECALCKGGDSRHCPDRTVLGIVGRDGAHAEFLRLPLRNLLPVPEKVIDEHAVFAEPLAAACGIIERVNVEPKHRVAVIGDGKLGLLCAQALELTGAHVVLIGKHADKLRIAERCGIETATPKAVAKLKREFDVVVEASGSPSGMAGALEMLRPRGTLVLKSTFEGPSQLDGINQAQLVVDEITITGSRCGRMQPALDLLKKGAIDLDGLISEEYPLAKGVHAMERAGKKGVLKVFLRP